MQIGDDELGCKFSKPRVQFIYIYLYQIFLIIPTITYRDISQQNDLCNCFPSIDEEIHKNISLNSKLTKIVVDNSTFQCQLSPFRSNYIHERAEHLTGNLVTECQLQSLRRSPRQKLVAFAQPSFQQSQASPPLPFTCVSITRVRILSARRYFFSSRKDRPAMSPARVISNALYYPSSVERGRGMEKRCEDRTCDMWNGRIKSWYAVDRLGLRETTEERDSIIRTRVVKPRGGSSADRTLKLPGV